MYRCLKDILKIKNCLKAVTARKPGKMPSEFLFSLCSLRPHSSVLSPTLQQSTNYRHAFSLATSPGDPRDHQLLMALPNSSPYPSHQLRQASSSKIQATLERKADGLSVEILSSVCPGSTLLVLFWSLNHKIRCSLTSYLPTTPAHRPDQHS